MGWVARIGTWAAMVTMTITALWLLVVAVIILTKGVGTPIVAGLPSAAAPGAVQANAAAVYGIGAAIGILGLLVLLALLATWGYLLGGRQQRA